MAFKNFNDFLFESEDTDTRVVDFLASLARNYEGSRAFYTDQLQYMVDEERRDWRDPREYAELEKKVTHEAFYKQKFSLDQKPCLLEVNFDYIFVGKKEKDAPETMSDEDAMRLNVVLEEIKLKKIVIKSTDLDYKSTEISEPIRKACEALLIKVLEADYDMLGAEIYKIEQT